MPKSDTLSAGSNVKMLLCKRSVHFVYNVHIFDVKHNSTDYI